MYELFSLAQSATTRWRRTRARRGVRVWGAVLAGALAFGAVARAASVSFGSTAPTLGPNDVSNLTGATTNKSSNVDVGGDDDSLYIASDRPTQGQTFTTGANANGYALTAITLRQVSYDTYAFVPDITYHIRITSPAGSTLSVLADETAAVPEDSSDCSTCNFPTISGGNSPGPGSGRYITFTLATNVVLNPNTTYGFDIGGVSGSYHYWETDGTSNSVAYAGGTAYSSGTGVGNTSMTERTGDRLFVVALTAAAAPLPPRFHSQPQALALYETRTAQLAAKASGSPTLVYQWQKSGAKCRRWRQRFRREHGFLNHRQSDFERCRFLHADCDELGRFR